jgi:hypothetical protein
MEVIAFIGAILLAVVEIEKFIDQQIIKNSLTSWVKNSSGVSFKSFKRIRPLSYAYYLRFHLPACLSPPLSFLDECRDLSGHLD